MCPLFPTALDNAIVSAPDPLPASTTRAPGNKFAQATIAPISFGYITVAIRFIFKVYSALVGLKATSQWPVFVCTQDPSTMPMRSSWLRLPMCDSNWWSDSMTNIYWRSLRSDRMTVSPVWNAQPWRGLSVFGTYVDAVPFIAFQFRIKRRSGWDRMQLYRSCWNGRFLSYRQWWLLLLELRFVH